jgi:hypothetical protein
MSDAALLWVLSGNVIVVGLAGTVPHALPSRRNLRVFMNASCQQVPHHCVFSTATRSHHLQSIRR